MCVMLFSFVRCLVLINVFIGGRIFVWHAYMQLLHAGSWSAVTSIKVKQSQNSCRIFTVDVYSSPSHVHTHSTKVTRIFTVLTLKVLNQTHKLIVLLSMECSRSVENKSRCIAVLIDRNWLMWFTRQTSEYGTQLVMTWRMWANISLVGTLWFLLLIWEEYGSTVGGSIRTRPYGTQMGQICAEIFGILVKWSHMVLIWALYGLIAYMGQTLVPHWQKYTVNRKKHIKMFLSYLLQNQVDSLKIWYTLSWINSQYSSLNLFVLTWIMSLHYLVKLSVVL